MGEKDVLMSHICSPLPVFSYFSVFLPHLKCFTNTNMLVFDFLVIRLTNQLSLWGVRPPFSLIVFESY